MDFEQALTNEIVSSFFEPKLMHQTVMNPGTGQMEMQPYYTEAPALTMVRALFKAQENKIMEQVAEIFDIEKVAQTVAEQVLKSLAEPDNRGDSWSTQLTAGEQFRKDVRIRTIEILAEIKSKAILSGEEDVCDV